MSTLAARLARLEAALPVADAAEDAQSRQQVVEMLARYAEGAHAEAEALAAGRPVRVLATAQRSPAENAVRAAMTEAEADGPWGSPSYAATFWRSATTRLLALVRARQALEAAQEGAAV